MSEMNLIYSVLAKAAHIQPGKTLRATTEILPQADPSLEKLLFEAPGDPEANIAVIIAILSASPLWQKLLDKVDKLNTYDIPITPVGKSGLSFNRLLAWAKKQPLATSTELSYNCTNDDSPIVLVVDRLMSAIEGALTNG